MHTRVMANNSRNKSGFTIVELLISTAIASVLTLMMVTISIYFYGDMLRAQATAELAIESQVVLRKVIDDSRLADSIKSSGTLADANAPSGGWVTNDPSNVLIIGDPATDSSRNIIYNPSDSFPYENEVVYFASSGGLYRRILNNPSAVGDTAVTTCPQALASSTCPADTTLSSNVVDLSFTFYDINNVSTANASLARSIAITVNMQRKIYGTIVSFNNTVRTTLRNY